MDIGVYCVEAMVGLFGRPKQVVAVPVFLKDGIDGAGTIVAEYDAMVVELVYSKITKSHAKTEIQGEDGIMLIPEIVNPGEIEIIYNTGEVEKVGTSLMEGNMVFEVAYFIQAIKEKAFPKKYREITEISMEILDEARKQMGVVFPADE